MIWDGKSVLINWGYKPKTDIAIEWHKRADGNWRGSDRSVDEDVYQAEILFRGPESELIDLNDVLNDNRAEFNSTFNSGEEIFGADVDHSGTVPIIATQYKKIRQVSFKAFEMGLTVRNANPTFKSVTPDFTQLRTATHQNSRETVFEMLKLFTYDNQAYIADRISNDGKEEGVFKAQFTQNQNEMPAIRRYLTLTARANKIPFPTFGGITKPFGPRSESLPLDCRIISWDDIGRQNFCDWNLSITFAREFSRWND